MEASDLKRMQQPYHHAVFILLQLLFLPALSDDVRSLLEFKKGIHDDPSGTVLRSWALPPEGSAACPSSWSGISCGGDGAASVVGVSLSGLGLTGDLKFSTLSGMASLKNLTLSGNNLTGRLVPSMGSLSSLQHLDLSNNRFYGKIPDRISDLWGLLHLNLSGNQFSEPVPAGIQNLQQLRVLDLRSNNLWGDLALVLSQLRNAEHIDLSSNGFTGGVFMPAGNIWSLVNTVQYMNLSNNKLDGGFFGSDSIKLFRKLEVFDFGNNRLAGELPSFDSLPSLRVLRAGNNLFSGPIPGGLFESAMPLEELDLSGNGLTGNIQSVSSTSLKVLNLSSNALSGELPSSLGACTSVDLSRNMLSGDLSLMQDWEDTLESIDLSSNMLSGYYPNETAPFGNLMSVRIRNNSLVGILPSVIGSYPRLSILDLSSNKLTGPILPNLFSSLTLTSLNLSGNIFTGSITIQSSRSTESLVLTSYSHLENLDLSDNALSGSLPREIGNLLSLKLLNLHNNSMSGELPNEISNLGSLEVLDISINHFKGRIPEMLQQGLHMLNVSYNDLSGTIPQSLERFPSTSFHPGNDLLVYSGAVVVGTNTTGIDGSRRHRFKSGIRVAIIVGSIGTVILIFFVAMAFYRIRSQEVCGRNRFIGQASGRDVKLMRFGRPNMFKSSNDESVPTSMSFSNDLLLTSTSRSFSAKKELLTETVEYGYPDSKDGGLEPVKLDELQHCPPTTALRSSPGSPLSSSPHFIHSQVHEQPVMLDVYSPDRLAGELFFLDNSLHFTAEDLSRAPAEVIGRSSHGTSYKATLDSGHMLTVKWLRVGLVKHKKDFAKEAKRIGSIRHPNIISWRGYYWGPREQERLIIADYVNGDSLALHLYESTPRRYSRLSVSQRLKIVTDIARSLYHLHLDWGLPHGNIKPSNILLIGPDLTARLTDYGLHRLMTPDGTSEQILNLGALGYRAPELATAGRPLPSFKADVYAFGVILLELLTRKSAGDIISGQTGAVDLTDWVQMCTREGRGTECFDRDITGLEEAPRAMERLLFLSLRCILPVNERPNIRTVYDDLRSITM